MDWNAAIEKNREALKRILATLVGMAALAGGGTSLSRHLHRAVLSLLLPAESAARRLIIAAARGIVVALPPVGPPCCPSPIPPGCGFALQARYLSSSPSGPQSDGCTKSLGSCRYTVIGQIERDGESWALGHAHPW